MGHTIVPSLFVKSKGEQTVQLALKLTTAPRKFVVRFTGGCGKMSRQDAEDLYELFDEAFVGFQGAMLFGGTRMLSREDSTIIVPGITEVVHRIRTNNPQSISLGVVPRTSVLCLSDLGMIVENDPQSPYLTIVHPEQDICLMVQVATDCPEVWDAEYQECQRIMEDLRGFAGFQTLLICYNGGTVTERELLVHAKKGWPVLLIEGSGRTTDRYASDSTFLSDYPNVRVAEKSASAIRTQLIQSGALSPDKLRLVQSGRAS